VTALGANMAAIWQQLPAVLLVAAAAAGLTGWTLLLRLSRRYAAAGLTGLMHNFRNVVLLSCRLALGFVGVYLTFQALRRILLLATNWPIWPVALATVGLVEAIIWLYRLERRIVPRRTGLALTALRVALLALLALMLIQPVWVSVWSETRRRAVAVLVDASASMQIADRQLRPYQKLRLAEAFSVPAARRPYRLEEQAQALRELRGQVLAQADRLDALAANKARDLRRRLLQRRKKLHKAIADWQRTADRQLRTVEAVLSEVKTLPQPLRATLLDAKAKLARTVLGRLKAAGEWTDKDQAEKLTANFRKLREALHQTVAALSKAAPALEQVAAALDELLYKQLGPADRRAVDAAAELTRLELARAVLLHRPEGKDDNPGEGLLAQLRRRYDVKVYTFAAKAAEADPNSWKDPFAAQAAGGPASAAAPATAQAGLAARRHFADRELQTDLAAALSKALADLGAEDLAGVVVLSDGQHNAPGKLEPLVRQLGASGAAFCAVALGGQVPPPDAAIIAVECPDTVYKEDRVYLNAELKLDGLDGQAVTVSLYDGQKRVASEEIRVSGNVLRRRVQLAHEPKKTGLHRYRLEVRPKPARAGEVVHEVFADNNAYDVTVSVTDDRTKVLLVDSRPRWEFRYLKNLFSGRDKTVKLQYVLTRPDRFFGQPDPPQPIYASASRPVGQEEATALPENAQEWMKFDVIILGDLAPEDFGPKLDEKLKQDPAAVRQARQQAQRTMRIIRKFVADRGGTLIFIAGPRAMPQAHARSELAELIPLELKPIPSAKAGPEAPKRAHNLPKEGFRIVPTPEGIDHVVLRQDVDPDKSRAVWKALPAIYWHSRFTCASPAATVLAYALSPKAPKWLTGPDPVSTNPKALAKRRREYYRKHALIAVAPHGLGKVMMLCFDRTWRLRYRVGDLRHHRFWGQVIRWATAGKLPAGTHLVKLGTDKTRYPPHSRPIVRAKIVRKDLTPVITKEVAVKVIKNGKVIGRYPMRYLKDSPGMYTATLDELPAGSYTIELDSPEAEKLLTDQEPKTVATEISVDPSTPAEEIELAANRHLLQRLAALSHNGVVVTADKARRILRALPGGQISRRHRREFLLWDSWWLLGLFCALATAEWVLRKRVGLA